MKELHLVIPHQMTCLLYTSDTFIARLAKIATDLRLEDWDDNTHNRFSKNLTKYKATAEQYHSKTEQKNDSHSDSNYQVTFVDESGTTNTKRFDRVEITKRGKLLLNAISSDIESKMCIRDRSHGCAGHWL